MMAAARRRRRDPIDRFEEKFIPEPNSGCWLWLAASGHAGYGQFFIDGTVYPASKAAWMLYKGPVPDGMDVCHRCDVSACVNPDHLFIGTHLENMQDCMQKGRFKFLGSRPGEMNAAAVLTEADVLVIRASSKSGRALAHEYGVSATTITEIQTGKTWSHLPGARPARKRPQLTPEQRAMIGASPEKPKVLAARFGISEGLVYACRKERN
jgi:hypothetical protein